MVIRNVDNDKLAICIVSEFPPPPGGIGQQARLLSDLLKEEGYLIYEVPTNINLKGRISKLQHLKYLKTIIALSYFLRRLIYSIPKVEIVHILASSYLNFFLFTIPAILAGTCFKKKIIVHYRGGAADSFIKKWKGFVKFPIKMAHHLLVPSGFLYSIFMKHGFQPVIVPNIANLSLFQFKDRNDFCPRLFIARHLEPIYNISCAIRAFTLIRNHYPNAQLIIAGSGSQEKHLKRLVDEYHCAEAVSFLGRVPNDEIVKWYHEADIVINTSNVDNMPISILEAFASGCPVVSTRAGGIPFLIENNKTGILVGLDDYKGVADAVRRIVEHPKETREMVRLAKKRVEMFSWREIRKKILKVYGVRRH